MISPGRWVIYDQPIKQLGKNILLLAPKYLNRMKSAGSASPRGSSENRQIVNPQK